MRTAAIGTIAITLAGIISFLYIGTASAGHGHETLDLNECQAFQFVLEANDQLYLCRFEIIELTHASSSDDLGIAGVLLVIEEDGAPVEIANIPRLGVGLAGIYFNGSDLTVPTFSSTTVDAYLTQNPSFFPTPDESTHIDIVFNPSTASFDTQDLLTQSLWEIIFRIEFQDETIPLETLITGGGITDEGRIYVEEAFDQLTILVSAAFALPTISVVAVLDSVGVPAAIQALQAAGRATYFATGLRTYGKLIGTGYTTTVLIINGIILAIFALVARKFSKVFNHKAIYFATIPMLLIDAYIGAIGFDVFIVYVDIIFIIGTGMFVSRHIPG